MTKSNLTDCWHFLIQPLALSWHLHPPKLNVKKIINKFYFYRWLFLLVQPVLTPGALAKHVVQVQGDGLGVDEVLHLLLDVGRQQPHQGLGREPVLCPLLVITLYNYTSYQHIHKASSYFTWGMSLNMMWAVWYKSWIIWPRFPLYDYSETVPKDISKVWMNLKSFWASCWRFARAEAGMSLSHCRFPFPVSIMSRSFLLSSM